MKILFFIILIVLISLIFSTEYLPKKFEKCYKKCTIHKVEASVKKRVNCIEHCLPKLDNVFEKERKEKIEKKEKNKKMSDSNSGEILDPEILWQKYRTALFDFFRMGDKKALPNLMLHTTPFSAENFEDAPNQLYRFLNTEPIQSSTYEKSNNNDIPTNYGEFIRNIPLDKSDPIKESQIEDLENKASIAKKVVDAQYIKCYSDYLAVNDIIKKMVYKDKFENYLSSNCFTIRQEQSKYDKALLEADQARQLSPNSLLNLANRKFSEIENSQPTSFNWELGGSINSFMQAAKEKRTNEFSVEITSRTKKTTDTRYTSEFKVGVKACFYGVTLEAGYNQRQEEIHLTTSESKFSLKFGAKGYKAVPVYPGSWFTQSAINTYKNGPFMKQPISPYFGKAGRMSLIPKTMYLVVGPTIEMFVSKEDKESFKKIKTSGWNAEISYLKIVGVNFEAKNSKIETSDEEKDGLYKVTITGNSYEPQVLLTDYDYIE